MPSPALIAKTLGSTSIQHQSNVTMLDQCLINIQMVFAIWALCCIVIMVKSVRSILQTKREDTRGSPRMLVLTAYVALIIISMCLMLTTVGEDSSAVSGSSSLVVSLLNTLKPRSNGQYFTDDIYKGICLNENVYTGLNQKG